MIMKKMSFAIKILPLILAFGIRLDALTVQMVKVDSVWNTDSSWTDSKGNTQIQERRDCMLSFKPVGEGTVQCSLSVSLDSGKTFLSHSKAPFAFGDGSPVPLPCNVKARWWIRMIGGDRPNVVLRMTSRQYPPFFIGSPVLTVKGAAGELSPGQPCEFAFSCKIIPEKQVYGVAPVAKVYWDALGDGSVNDSTDTLSWIWKTTVPSGATGQRQPVIVKAKDVNGNMSEPCTLWVQFGLQSSLNMVSIPGGTFLMGSTLETKIHSVTLSAFKMGATEVTQELYSAVMKDNPSHFSGLAGSLRPVESVTWDDAAYFCNALSRLSGKDTVYRYSGVIDSSVVIDYSKNGYRLPTEAEWEYAARGGATADYYWGKSYPMSTKADTIAADSHTVWAHNSLLLGSTSSLYGTHAIAEKKPNNLGLYDMSGNVSEWVNDVWSMSYKADAQNDPTGPTILSTFRSWRGGNWTSDSRSIRSSYRTADYGFMVANFRGFRKIRPGLLPE